MGASQAVSWARVRLAQWLGRAAIASVVAAMISGPIGAAGAEGRGYHPTVTGDIVTNLGAGFWVLGLALFIASFVLGIQRASGPGTVTFDSSAIEVSLRGRARRIERSQIASAYAVTRYSHPRRIQAAVVELELVGGDLVSFEVATDEAARAAVGDLGFGSGKRRTRIALGTPLRRLSHLPSAFVAYAAVALVASATHVLFPMWRYAEWSATYESVTSALAMVLAYSFLLRVLRAPELTIGDDGVSYRSGRTGRFLAGASVTHVEHTSAALTLRSSSDGPLVVHGSGVDLERRVAVARLAYERFVGPAATADDAARQFAREGRPVAAWREHLRARTGHVGYRDAASSSDVAAAVLHNARSSGEQRVGAALALRAAGDPEGRIRVAASAVACDGLRAALEAVAEGEDELVIGKALRKLT
jgi:hypothetical protein